MEQRVDLDIVGTICGSDKCSTFKSAHDYLRHYEYFFDDFRQREINIIEIGVQKGPSLKAWKWYFPRAQIVGIDIQARCLRLREERVDIMVGSQADIPFMKEVCAKYPPTIVIDDGSHLAEHNIVTFEAVFPLVAPGGLYVVEDMACHFGAHADKWQSDTPRDAPGYFMRLAMNRVAWAREGWAGSDADVPPAEICDMVDSVTTIGGCVIIRKADAGRNVARALEMADAFVKATHPLDALGHARLAYYILEQKGPLERAKAEIAAAVKLDATPDVRRVEALVMMAAGDAKAAAAALAAADAANTPEDFLRRPLTLLRKQLQREERRSAARHPS